MRLEYHPHVDRDLQSMAQHVAVNSQSKAAARKRLKEVENLIKDILAVPGSGNRLDNGWLVRHGGADRMITVVFRPNVTRKTVQIAIVAFGGKDWVSRLPNRAGYFP